MDDICVVRAESNSTISGRLKILDEVLSLKPGVISIFCSDNNNFNQNLLTRIAQIRCAQKCAGPGCQCCTFSIP